MEMTDHTTAPVVSPKTALATLGGGCFWCVEAVYLGATGITGAVSGYMGGAKPNPTYEQVCSGRSGHVEVVQITYDPAIIGFRDILEIFFATHDPTTLNRQGNDAGPQYRSVVFFHSEEQAETARSVIAELNAGHAFEDPVVTAVEPATTFYPAENYHQRYFENNPNQPYCAYVVAPKVRKFRAKFPERLKS